MGKILNWLKRLWSGYSRWYEKTPPWWHFWDPRTRMNEAIVVALIVLGGLVTFFGWLE